MGAGYSIVRTINWGLARMDLTNLILQKFHNMHSEILVLYYLGEKLQLNENSENGLKYRLN